MVSTTESPGCSAHAMLCSIIFYYPNFGFLKNKIKVRVIEIYITTGGTEWLEIESIDLIK